MTTGVEMTEISSRIKATNKSTVRGVAGRSIVFVVFVVFVLFVIGPENWAIRAGVGAGVRW